MAYAGASAAAAAAEAKRRREEEEEEMTSYTREELENDFEFKIVRANTAAFGKPANFAKLLEEEARAGWQLVEKFDNNRVRFKRPLRARQRDATLPPGVDPYRVHYGMSENAYGGIIALVILGIFGAVALVIFVIETVNR